MLTQVAQLTSPFANCRQSGCHLWDLRDVKLTRGNDFPITTANTLENRSVEIIKITDGLA